MSRSWQLFIACFMLTISSSRAQGVHQVTVAKDGMRDQLAAIRMPLEVREGQFSGTGWQAVLDGVTRAKFIGIGEDHFTKEIPSFVSALCEAIGRNGLAAMAWEAGPEAAKLVTQNLGAADHEQVMMAHIARYPDSVAFLNSAQENRLASHCAMVSGQPGFEIWGLDQELMGAGGWLLDMILEQPLTRDARVVVESLKKQEIAAAANAMASGDPSQLFILSVADKELEAAHGILERGGNDDSRRLFQSIEVTHRIYKENADGSPQSNLDRSLLLKQTLMNRLEHLDARLASGKILFKFGDWHLYRGFNPLHERDLGNFIAEYGDVHGSPSLHIAILGARGVHASYAGYHRPMHEEAFVMSDDPDYRWLKSAIDAAEPTGWTVFDMRRLRGHGLKDLSVDWQRMAEGYDLLILAPVVTPASASMR